MTTGTDTSITDEAKKLEEEIKAKLNTISECSQILFVTATKMCKEDTNVFLSMIVATLSRAVVEVIAVGMDKPAFEAFIAEFVQKVKENITMAFTEISNINAANAAAMQNNQEQKIAEPNINK